MTRILATFAAVLLATASCAPDPADVEMTRGGRVDVYFNDPGTRPDNLWEPDAVDIMIETVRGAQSTIDMAVMGFNRTELVDELVRAYDRGVAVRMVGDASHVANSGYTRFRDRHIPMVAGNQAHIMHNKFMVVDGRFVFGGTANWTDSDLRKNSNNFFLVDNPAIAADFTTEFEQMFHGNFGQAKSVVDNGNTWQVGDTTVEVWFAPKEDCMGRMLELVDGAQDSIRFTIFAFTKDTLGSALLRKQGEFSQRDAAEGVGLDADFRDRRSVAGVIDQSQLHSNGQFHEVYRLLAAGIPMRMDANDNSDQPGDYQAGGGRLHSKTMVIDADGANPVVITGSFNWSASATQSNDEYLLVLKGPRVAKIFDGYFNDLWGAGRPLGNTFIGSDLGDGRTLAPGDIVLNELMWYGVTPQEPDGFDEYIELRNTTPFAINLDLWQIANAADFVVGLPPGTVIPANGTYLILDHTLEVYQDGVPQDQRSAFSGGDMVVNAFNDNRQARLYLKDGQLDLRLQDPKGQIIDRAGDGGPAFFGGPSGGALVRSMERRATAGDGTDPASWYACTAEQGGANVNEDYKDVMIGTPGEPNSPEP
jgi:phosphatidylserine/phosphatidylglycerophosphate/cardiolipin synthase-like enzyme